MARWRYVEVEVDLREFDTDDLIEELEDRGCKVLEKDTIHPDEELVLRQIYEAKKLDQNIDKMLADYLYQKLGVIL